MGTNNSWILIRKLLLEDLDPKKYHGKKAEFIRFTGFSRASVDRWLSESSAHNSIPGIDDLDKIASWFKVQPWELIKPDGALPTPAPQEPGVSQLLRVIEELTTALKAAQKKEAPARIADIVQALNSAPEVDLETVRSVLGIRKTARKNERKSG